MLATKLTLVSLPGVIAEYGKERKPLMVFCFTRKSCEETAETLSQWWADSHPQSRYWNGPRKLVQLKGKMLQSECCAEYEYS